MMPPPPLPPCPCRGLGSRGGRGCACAGPPQPPAFSLHAARAVLQPEEELVEDENGALDADVGAVFTVTITKGGKSLV